MDVGYIRGPANLQDVMNSGATPQGRTQQSYDGYNSYLLIIDAASRYMFVYMMKSGTPPIKFIDAFLKKYGNAFDKKKLITTNPDGILHKSKSFKHTCKHYGYDNDTYKTAPTIDMTDDDIEQLRQHQLHHTIRTDNGTKLAGSTEFRETANNHGYLIETTGPDSSSQNGIAERPHRTLKDKTRCLLYSAGLDVKFWSDAL